MRVAPVDILLIVIYCAFVLAIGFRLWRQMVGSAEFRPQRELVLGRFHDRVRPRRHRPGSTPSQVTNHKSQIRNDVTHA
jgi:hypothetical protein